jgi:hypothetical protein
MLTATVIVSNSKLSFGEESIGSIQHHAATKNKNVVDQSLVPLEVDQRGECVEKQAASTTGRRPKKQILQESGRSSSRGGRPAPDSSFPAASRPSMESPPSSCAVAETCREAGQRRPLVIFALHTRRCLAPSVAAWRRHPPTSLAGVTFAVTPASSSGCE